MPRASARTLTAFCSALLLLGAAPKSPTSDASSLLYTSMKAGSHLSFVGRVSSIRFGQARSEATVYTVEHSAPNLTRRSYVAPGALFGDWSVARGNTVWSVDVHNKRIVSSTNNIADDQIALDNNFSLLISNYRPLVNPDETVAGRTCSVLALINRYTGQIAMRLWIDKATQFVLQKELYAGNGAITRTLRFDQIRYISSLPSTLFAEPHLPGFVSQRGMNHGSLSNDLNAAIKSAGFEPAAPKFLPNGFLPLASDVSDIKGVRTLHILYSDGLRTVSLFENVRGAAIDLSHYRATQVHFENSDGNIVQDGPTTLLGWQDSGLSLALVGELSRSEILKIASSVKR